MTDRPIDIWYGLGSGQSIRLKGEMVDGKVRITDEKWLDNIGWDEPYWEYPAHELDDSYWVSYDDYGWSEIDTVPEDLLVKDASVIGTDELHAQGVQRNPGVSVEKADTFFFDEVAEMNEQKLGEVEKILAQARERTREDDGVMIFYGTPRRK